MDKTYQFYCELSMVKFKSNKIHSKWLSHWTVLKCSNKIYEKQIDSKKMASIHDHFPLRLNAMLIKMKFLEQKIQTKYISSNHISRMLFVQATLPHIKWCWFGVCVSNVQYHGIELWMWTYDHANMRVCDCECIYVWTEMNGDDEAIATASALNVIVYNVCSNESRS